MNSARLQVFDMQGRLAGEVDIAGKSVVDLGKELGIRGGIWLVKWVRSTNQILGSNQIVLWVK